MIRGMEGLCEAKDLGFEPCTPQLRKKYKNLEFVSNDEWLGVDAY